MSEGRASPFGSSTQRVVLAEALRHAIKVTRAELACDAALGIPLGLTEVDNVFDYYRPGANAGTVEWSKPVALAFLTIRGEYWSKGNTRHELLHDAILWCGWAGALIVCPSRALMKGVVWGKVASVDKPLGVGDAAFQCSYIHALEVLARVVDGSITTRDQIIAALQSTEEAT